MQKNELAFTATRDTGRGSRVFCDKVPAIVETAVFAVFMQIHLADRAGKVHTSRSKNTSGTGSTSLYNETSSKM